MKSLSMVLTSLILFIATAYTNDHAEVSTRMLPDEKKQMQEEIIQKELLEEAAQEEAQDCDEIQTGGAFDNKSPAIFFPYSCHSITSVSALADQIVLEDGSTWTLSNYYSSIITSWKSSDPLFIYPNRNWFSAHKYKIVNQVTGDSVPVTLTLGPRINGDFSLQVVTIDFAKSEVYLNDNSVWFISPGDRYILEEWRAGDYIIVGHNNSWFGSSKHILLNSNMYNHVRSIQY